MSEVEQAVIKALNEKVAELKRMLVPHHCFTCLWFVLREEKPHNRVCRFPGDLQASPGGACMSWQVQPDSSKWVVNKNMGT